MKLQRAYKFRLYPNREQEILFRKTFGCCRFLYNRMLGDRMKVYEETGKISHLTPAAYKKEYPWLRDVDSLALANVQLHLEAAYRKFFRYRTGYPKFKSRHNSRASYTTNVVNGNIRLTNDSIRLPKAGEVKIRCHRDIPDEYDLKSVTVSMEPSGHFYASLLYQGPDFEPLVHEVDRRDRKVLEIQFASDRVPVFSDEISVFFDEITGQADGTTAFSDGTHVCSEGTPGCSDGMPHCSDEAPGLSEGSILEYPSYCRKAEQRLMKQQKKLSHCKKGSRNYEKQKKIVIRCREKVKNQKKDYLHKLSRAVADSYDEIVAEVPYRKDIDNLRTVDGEISYAYYDSFRHMLRYKLSDQGKRMITVKHKG